MATAPQFLELIDPYAEGREFFDDDPTSTLERFGLTEADFSVDAPWDQFAASRPLHARPACRPGSVRARRPRRGVSLACSQPPK